MSEEIGLGRGILSRARRSELLYTTGLRVLFALGLAAAIIGTAGTADAAVPKKAKKEKETRKAAAPMPKGPLNIIVSLGKQRLFLYANGVQVATSAISSGTKSHPTPTGVFSIIQKNRHHRSNIYSGAPMPYMQRITWSGVALHQGVLPGYPASHGCIRLPGDFASYLWTATKMNVRVIVTHGEPTPVEVAHPRLFVFKKSEPPAAPEALETPKKSTEAPAPVVRTADAADPRKATDAPKPGAAMVAGGTASKVSAEHPERNKIRESSKLTDNGAVDTSNTTSNAAKNAAKEGSKAPAATGTVAAPAPAAPTRVATSVAAPAPAAPAPVAAAPAPAAPTTRFAAPAAAPVAVPAAPAPVVAAPAPAVPAPAAAPAPAAPPPVALDLKPTVPATAVPLPPVAPVPKLVLEATPASKVDDPAKTEEAAKPKPPKPDPVSVFISRKTGKLYVRHGYEPLFEVPVTIRNPDALWGTHVFTALEFKEDKSTLRWIAVTLPPDAPRRVETKRTTAKNSKASARPAPAPPPPAEPRSQLSAAQVLDILDIPQEAIDRISELMKPGSSLILSDNPISHETGKGTDFVILTRS